MSITAYTGLPGSGKSYEVVNGPILQAINTGREVWTNIPCNIVGVYVVTPDEAKGHWYLGAPDGAVIVVDECWRYWAAGLKADGIPEDHRSFFAEHRHRTKDGVETDIVLVTQDLSQVAKFVRELIDQTFRMRKLNAIGASWAYRVDVYRGCVTGQRPPESQFISGQVKRYRKEGFARYKSHTKGQEAKGVIVDKRGTLWRRPAVLMMIVVVCCVPFLGNLLDGVFGAPEHEAPAVAIAPPSAIAVPVHTPEPVQEPEKPHPVRKAAESETWTLLGVVVRADGSGRALLRSPTGRRTIDVSRCAHAIEWACDVDGKVVAYWTGNGVLARAQGTTYHKADGS